MNLDELRKQIDELDEKLVRLLNERTQIALDIGSLKAGKGDESYAPAREKMVLDRVQALNEGPLPSAAVRAVYREVMSASMALERPTCIAYLGPEATSTHLASRAKFGSSVSYAAHETITDVFSAVEKGTANYGVVPIENSTDGAVTHTLDQCVETPLKICAEIYLPISQYLMSKTPQDQIKRIYSKEEVFGQCRGWLHENMPGVEHLPVSSTAKAAEIAAEETGAAALASSVAAEMYGLDVLAKDVQDLGGNTTRFLVLGKSYGQPTGNDKTSVFFAVKHKAGALYGALEAFKNFNLNMTKIESRPSRTKAWEYFFFVDFEGHADDSNSKEALAHLSEHCTIMTVLGSYPNAMGAE